MIRLSAREVRPDAADVLRHQGIPAGAAVSPRLHALVRNARAAFDALVSPAGVFDDVSPSEFAAIYAGAGLNEPATPMQEILPRAEALALFAATIGPGMETEIRRRLGAWDAAFACTLDAFASAATERLADLVAREYLRTSGHRVQGPSPTHVVPYSPGYCGWHVSGQRSLFDRLRPAEIGIELNDRCFMAPAKSVSGVLVAGPSETHRFRAEYSFCDVCATRECHERLRMLRGSN